MRRLRSSFALAIGFAVGMPIGLMPTRASYCRAAEIVGVETADASTLVLLVRNDGNEETPSQEAARYAVNDRSPVRVGRLSAVIYEEKKGTGGDRDFPLHLLHRLFLVLQAPLTEGTNYRITAPFGSVETRFQSGGTICESIKANQVGYHPRAARRYAFYAPWLGDLGGSTTSPSDYQVVKAGSGEPALTGRPEPLGDSVVSGGPVWRLDLSGLSEPGEYRIVIPGVGSSPSFRFGEDAAHHAFYVHLKGLYHQRCGTALVEPFTRWTRPACHQELGVTDANPPGFISRDRPSLGSVPAGGGHHDAGDFDVRLSHTLVAGYLLNAFELYPHKFTDGQLDLPESGNGIPDLLDEALWSIRAWEHLQEKDGGIRAGFETHRHPAYGEVTAATDDLAYRAYRRHGHSTLAGGALMAYAARLVRPFQAARAKELLTNARRAWTFYQQHRDDPDYQWSPGARLFAACQLYLATREPTYHEAMREPASLVFGIDGQKPKWPAEYLGHLANLPYLDGGMVVTHYFAGYLLAADLPKEAVMEQAFREAILRRADEVQRDAAQPGFAAIKLGDWGASTAYGRYADYLFHAHRLTGERKYLDTAALLADWTLGANPAGRCFTTGIGWRPPYNPLSLDSYDTIRRGLGPVPGIVVYGITNSTGGAVYERIVRDRMHPPFDATPAGRRYSDGWSLIMQNEYTVWETMAPNCLLHAALAPDRPMAGAMLPIGEPRPPGGYPAK